MAMMNSGQRKSKLAHQNTSSNSDVAPSMIRNIPMIIGHVPLLRPPKQSSSKSQSSLLYLYAGGFNRAPQFLHSVASSSFSVPHFVQYTKFIH